MIGLAQVTINPQTISSVTPAAWVAGETPLVTITGTGFGVVDSIRIGTETPSINKSGNSITFTAPSSLAPANYFIQLLAGALQLVNTEIAIVANPGDTGIGRLSSEAGPANQPQNLIAYVINLKNGDGLVLEVLDSSNNRLFGPLTGTPNAAGTEMAYTLPALPAGDYQLRFFNSGGFSERHHYQATVTFIPSDDRPDPTDDPDVRGVLNAQTAIAERFFRLQSGNINSRLSSLRSGESRDNRANDFNVSLNLPNSTRFRSREPGHEVDRPETGPGSISLGDLARTKGGPDGAGNADTALASVPPAAVPTRWSFWSDGSVSFGSLDEDGEVKLDHTTLGLTLGMDYAFGDRLISGLAIGYSHDKTDVGSNGSEVEGDGYTAALYASYLLRPNVFVEGMLGYTAIDFDTRRNTTEGKVKGDRDGDQYFASIAVGYEWCKESFTLTPFTRFETAITRLDEYSERGNSMALRYGKQDIEMYTGSLGLTASRTFCLTWAELTPSAGAEYAYNFKDDSRVALGYADTATMPYSFSATSVARNTVTATAGLEARFNRNFSLGLKYRGSFASHRDNHNISLQGVWSW